MSSMIPGPIRRGFEALLAPLVSMLVSLGVRPNTITTVGTLVLIGAAVSFATGLVRLGGALILLSGVFDMLDGRVARTSGGVSPFGAFYDSTLDRIGEAALFAGIVLFFMQQPLSHLWVVLAVTLSLIALSAGLIVSYARARAEGLGLECKVGLAQRAERVLLLGGPALFLGAGAGGWLLLAIVAVLAVMAMITVVQRIYHVYRTVGARPPEAVPSGTWPAAAAPDFSQKGRGGD